MKDLQKEKTRENILYKIFYKHEQTGEDILVYLGRTHQSLNNRLRGHFLKAPMMRELNPRLVSKIEFAKFKTEADMYVWEVILINKWKPPLNKDDKSKEPLTFDFPPIPFQEFECPHLKKWSDMVDEKDRQIEQQRREKLELQQLYQSKRQEIFRNENLSDEEKSELWWNWVETVYEPRKQMIDNF